MKKHPIHIDVTQHPVFVEFSDGTTMHVDTTSRESIEAANRAGCSFVWMGDLPKRLSRTPEQDHELDPHVRDPRPIRCLTIEQQRVWRTFVQRGAHIAVAAFETWRGLDRYLYMDVLGVGRTVEEAARLGCPVQAGEDWLPDLRMVGDQLALRMVDPWGRSITRKPEPGVEREPGYARVWTYDEDGNERACTYDEGDDG